MPARERRYILRSLFSPGSAKFWKLRSQDARLIFIAMLLNADDDGRIECDFASIKSLMPRWELAINYQSTTNQLPNNSAGTGNQLTRKVVSSAVQGLIKVGLIRTFEEDGKRLAEVLGFRESQKDKGFTFDSPQIPGPSVSFHTAPASPLLSTLVSKVKEVSKERILFANLITPMKRSSRRSAVSAGCAIKASGLWETGRANGRA